MPCTLDALGERLIERVGSLFPQATLAGEARNYQELHLAGHSLGGLGLRYVLNAIYDKYPKGAIRLTSFAPPYSGTFIGATFSGLAGRLGGSRAAILLGLYLAYSWRPILRDLDHKSRALQLLRDDSNALAKVTHPVYPTTRLFSASLDKVINTPPTRDYKYASDIHARMDGTHTSINKSQTEHDLAWI